MFACCLLLLLWFPIQLALKNLVQQENTGKVCSGSEQLNFPCKEESQRAKSVFSQQFMELSHRRRSRKVPLRPVVCAGISNGRCSAPGRLYHQLRSCDFAKEKRRHWAILAEERSIRVSKHVRASMQQSMPLKEEQAEVPWGIKDYIPSSLIFTAPCNRSEKWKSRGVLQSHVKIVILLTDQRCTCQSPASPRPPVCLGALVL